MTAQRAMGASLHLHLIQKTSHVNAAGQVTVLFTEMVDCNLCNSTISSTAAGSAMGAIILSPAQHTETVTL